MRRLQEGGQQFYLAGVRFRVFGDPLSNYIRQMVHASMMDLQKLKDRSDDSLEIIDYERAPFYRVRSRFGKDEIYVYPEVGAEKRKVELEREWEIPKEERRVYLTPAFEVWGFNEGQFTQLGYVTGAPGTWKPPYTFWPTDNVAPPDATKEQMEVIRANNPSVTVDPFMWCQYKAKNYTRGPNEIAAYKQYDGILQDKDILSLTKGTTRISIREIATKFEEFAYYPYYYNESGSWVRSYPVEVETTGYSIIDSDPQIYSHKHIKDVGSGYWAMLETPGYYMRYSAYKFSDWSFGTYLDINGEKVGSTEQPPRIEHYDFPLLWEMADCAISGWTFATLPNIAQAEALTAHYECVFSAWEDWVKAGGVGACDSSACGLEPYGGSPVPTDCDFCSYGYQFEDTVYWAALASHTAYPFNSDYDAVVCSLASREMQRGLCDKDFVHLNVYPIDRYASNCRDTSEHIFWAGITDYTDIKSYESKIYLLDNNVVWSDPLDGVLGKTFETVHEDYRVFSEHCVVNNKFFPWIEDAPEADVWMGEWRDDYLDVIHSRYYRFKDLTEPGSEFWCLVSAWNYDYDWELTDDGNYPGTKVWPDDAEVHRWIFMIYKSSDPDHFDMRPGAEFDKFGNLRGSADSSDCVGFDSDYAIEISPGYTMDSSVLNAEILNNPDFWYPDFWTFAIPGFQDNESLQSPDGGPLFCFGHYRLLEITEIEEPTKTKHKSKISYSIGE